VTAGARPDPDARLRAAAAAALLLSALLASSLWADLAALGRGSYAERRAAIFQGVPVDAIDAGLDRRLAPERRVGLAPALAANDFLAQRLAEAIHPRLVDSRAPHVLDAVIGAPDPTAGALARMGDVSFVLRGGIDAEVRAPEPAPSHPIQTAFRLGAIAIGVLGLGIAPAAWLARRRALDPALVAPLALVAGALGAGVAASAATWLGTPLPRALVPALGWIALVASIAARRGHGLRVSRPHVETLAFGAMLAALVAVAPLRPIALWDGRSIWLLQARRLFAHGLVPVAELRLPDARWSHPDYPLLLPAWIAQLAGAAPELDERLAALAIALLAAGCALALWALARARLGRAAGAAFALALLLAVDHATAGGYADGLLLLLLGIGFLAFASGERAAGWIALAAASLAKSEGLFLALPIALAFTVLEWRRAASLRLLLPGAAAFAPAVAHALWTRAQGVDSVLKEQSAAALLGDLGGRVALAVRLAPELWTAQGYTQLRQILWQGAAALLLVAALGLRRRSVPRDAALALLVAAAWIAFAFAAIGALPEPVDWFVESALDRLLAHPAALLVLAALLCLAPPPRARGRRADRGAASG
jgi:hypothetical protein